MRKMRVGIVGCGRIASEFEDLASEHPASIAGAFAAIGNTELVAAANRGQQRLESFGKRWGVQALYQDYRDMIARESLDIVAIATHPPLHAEIVEAGHGHSAGCPRPCPSRRTGNPSPLRRPRRPSGCGSDHGYIRVPTPGRRPHPPASPGRFLIPAGFAGRGTPLNLTPSGQDVVCHQQGRSPVWILMESRQLLCT